MTEIKDSNFDEFVKNNKTVIIDFWAPWCGPCRALGPICEKVADSHPEVAFGKCNVDDNPALCDKFGIQSIPFVVKIVDGKVVDNFLGLHEEAFVEEFFKA